ncbi:hypothetical protein L6452_20910 [Arctium lappa]|uniref:Uncharacterized protein n=1 Tax=Arctium lappa TaxID=4217 RepID=A0ACB9BEK6_ARCLA|nr:hypothetical protein L6452_20910 [Arctium lappa]
MESWDAEEDDAAFYAELTRQMLLLMDEDHEEIHSRNVELSRRSLVSSVTSGTGNYFSWWDKGPEEVPSWMERLWTAASNKGSGTGVFIPQVVAAGKSRRRRHNNKPKKNNVVNGGGRIFNSSTAKITRG